MVTGEVIKKPIVGGSVVVVEPSKRIRWVLWFVV
jgi:hypothetical protein